MPELLMYSGQEQVDSWKGLLIERVLKLQIVKLSLFICCVEESQTWHMFLINCTKAVQFP